MTPPPPVTTAAMAAADPPTLASALTAARRDALRAECVRLAALDDAEFAARLLANTPTHEARGPESLDRWAAAATEFGTELARERGESEPAPAPKGAAPKGAALKGAALKGAALKGASATATAGTAAPRIVERTGGLDALLLARYVSRPVPTVELYTDTLALGAELTRLLGWQGWFPPGSLRAAAVAHEEAHCLLQRDIALRRALRDRLGHTALRLGRLRIHGHVAGADELAAHAFAAARCGLGRHPLLLTTALASAAEALGEN